MKRQVCCLLLGISILCLPAKQVLAAPLGSATQAEEKKEEKKLEENLKPHEKKKTPEDKIPKEEKKAPGSLGEKPVPPEPKEKPVPPMPLEPKEKPVPPMPLEPKEKPIPPVPPKLKEKPIPPEPVEKPVPPHEKKDMEQNLTVTVQPSTEENGAGQNITDEFITEQPVVEQTVIMPTVAVPKEEINGNNPQTSTDGTSQKTVEENTGTVTDTTINITTSTTASSFRQEVVNYALRFVGNPYKWGGTSLTNGADCSGFVQSVYAHFNCNLSRTSREQASSSNYREVTPNQSELLSGDLIFYANSKGVVYHVAMYIGNGRIVHAANSRDGIIISEYTYMKPYKARRIIE